VSVREHIESCESFVIQEWWPDSRRVTDVEIELGAAPRRLPRPGAFLVREFTPGTTLLVEYVSH
jgi:hypothetical protein